jgi:hypothetical protein
MQVQEIGMGGFPHTFYFLLSIGVILGGGSRASHSIPTRYGLPMGENNKEERIVPPCYFLLIL